MQFATAEVISRPAAEVYAALTDFAGHEAVLAARGIRPSRVPGTEGPEPAWTADVPFRGRERRIEVAVTRMTPAIALDYRIAGAQLVSGLSFALAPVAEDRTRVDVTLDVRAAGVSGRMLLHSLRLVRPTLVRRFRKRVQDYARYLART